jgi:hypothetical protein
MKSHPHLSLVVLAMVTALLFIGCGHKNGIDHAPAVEAEPGVTFNSTKGLLVPAKTAKFIGLQVTEIEERKVSSALQFSAQVYRAANETQLASAQPTFTTRALASGVIGASDAASLRDGLSIMVTLGETNRLQGQVLRLNRELEKASGQVEVLLAIDDERGRLAKGTFVHVTAPIGGEKDVVSVPRSALFRTTEGDFVYTVSGDRFVRAAVQLGTVNHDFAEVTDGLYSGDQVVVTPVMTLWLAELQSIRGGKACADGQ